MRCHEQLSVTRLGCAARARAKEGGMRCKNQVREGSGSQDHASVAAGIWTEELAVPFTSGAIGEIRFGVLHIERKPA
jgi:hypothetical protein